MAKTNGCFLLMAVFVFLWACPLKGSSGLTELNTGCDVRIEKVGCYRDNMNPRPLSILVINDREGKSINWTQFEEYVNGLACRCAKKLKPDGYTYFGLQFYGECWTGKESQSQYDADGEAPSKMCVGTDLETCDETSDSACAGGANANFIYKISYAPPCEDLDPEKCKLYAGIGWCKTSEIVRENCKKACGLC